MFKRKLYLILTILPGLGVIVLFLSVILDSFELKLLSLIIIFAYGAYTSLLYITLFKHNDVVDNFESLEKLNLQIERYEIKCAQLDRTVDYIQNTVCARQRLDSKSLIMDAKESNPYLESRLEEINKQLKK